jgi:hypothetical protein
MEPDRRRGLEEVAAATTRDRFLIAGHRGEEQMASAPDKVAALIDTVRALESLPVSFALVGGVAVGIHSGVPRATADTDVAVLSTADREAVSRVMMGMGFRKTGDFRHSANFRHVSGEPVQIVYDAAFDAMIGRAERFQAAGTSVPIVTRRDLIAMKRRAAADGSRRRSKALRDQADVALLEGDVPDPDEGW